jgi:hypothetical protein
MGMVIAGHPENLLKKWDVKINIFRKPYNAKDQSFLECDAVSLGKCFLAVQWIVLPSS